MKSKTYQFKTQATTVEMIKDIESIFHSILAMKDAFFLIDRNVFELYGFENFFSKSNLNKKYFVVNSLEKNKTLRTVELICKAIQKVDIGEKHNLCCIGGGFITDTGGFVSSIYKRGIQSIFIPTTLTASVDAAFGGKNGVNLGAKNYLGTINHPKLVLVCTEFLNTLPEIEIRSGLVEALKKGILFDSNLAETSLQAASELNSYGKIRNELIKKIIIKSIDTKMQVVLKDENDINLRKSLNFGHTIGHGIEATLVDKITHGQAVAFGIIAESFIAKNMGYLSSKDYIYIRNSIEAIFPISLMQNLDIKKIENKIKFDKKNDNNFIKFAVPISCSKKTASRLDFQLLKIESNFNFIDAITAIIKP